MKTESNNVASSPHETNTNLSEVPPAVEEYVDMVSSVQTQLVFCQNEQERLRAKLQSVVSENLCLSEQLASLKDEPPAKRCDVACECLKNNMQQQLDLALEEKNSAVEMWQTSLQLITALETELQDYRSNSHISSALSQVEEVRTEYSRAISLLEEKLTAAQSRLEKEQAAHKETEKHYFELQNDFKLLNERYNKRTLDLDNALLGQQGALKRLGDLEKKYKESLVDAKEATLSCAELESALERSMARMEEALAREIEARDKVDEALQIVDAALAERDSALEQAAQSREEAAQLRKTISELITEAGTQVQAEAEQLKEMYNAKIKTVLVDMRRLQEENKSKTEQLQKLRADWSSMEDEVRRAKRDMEAALRDGPSLSALNRKIEGLFRAQDLAGEDAIHSELEREQLKAEIIKLNQNFELEQRQFALEKYTLEEQIRLLKSDLDNAACTVSDLSAQIEGLTSSLRNRDSEIDSLRKALSSSMGPGTSEDKRCSCAQLPHILEQLRACEKSSHLQNELQVQLDSQRKLAHKWKAEAHTITSRFQARLRELHSEVSSLRRQNRELYNQLQSTRGQLEQYKHQDKQIHHVNSGDNFGYMRQSKYETPRQILTPQEWSSSADSLGRKS